MHLFAFQTILPPIIMEVDNSPFGDKSHIFQDPIFHFHDYGRKGKKYRNFFVHRVAGRNKLLVLGELQP